MAQSRKFTVVVVVFLMSANAIARAPLGPSPWWLMSIFSRVMCSITKETGMIPSCEQASRYALRPRKMEIANLELTTK